MITFVTNREHNVNPNLVNIVSSKEAKPYIQAIYDNAPTDLTNKRLIPLDTETNGLDEFKNKPILLQIGDEENQVLIDLTSVKADVAFPKDKEDYRYVGQNIKFDYCMLKVNCGIDLPYVYDTMVAEQRITQNYSMPYNLVAILMRRLDNNKYPDVLTFQDKEIRGEFINFTSNSKFTTEQIIYGAKDVKYLNPLVEKQNDYILKFGMKFLIYGIENPLVRVLANAEMRGFVFDTEAWMKVIKENKDLKYELECKLDAELRRLRDNLPADRKLLLIGGEYDRVRNKPVEQINIGLFGEPVTNKALTGLATPVKANRGNINWGSSDQLIMIFAKLGQPLPTKDDDYQIPRLDKNGKIENKHLLTTGQNEIEQYFIERPNSEVTQLLKLLLEFREVKSELDKYGENFLDKVNPETGYIHTLYKQVANNGRLKSGGGKKRPDRYNSQNIPRKTKFRHCFKAREGYSILTFDLSGAEVCVMADKARDMKLFKLSQGDMHSYVAQKGWRNIFLFRAGEILRLWSNYDAGGNPVTTKHWEKSRNFFNRIKSPHVINTIKNSKSAKVRELYNKSLTFVVSKTENADVRQSCKNLTFGTVYGCKAKKAAKTIDVSISEGQVYIDTLKREFPNTFKMVADNVKFGEKNGYIVINERTNSRIWFQDVVTALKQGFELEYESKKDLDGQGRNVPISGTQADILKEIMVEINRFIAAGGHDIHLLAQVHDELVYEVPKNMDGHSEEWKKSPNKVSYVNRNGKLVNQSFFTYIKDTMGIVSDRYLKFIKMGAEGVCMDSWTKG